MSTSTSETWKTGRHPVDLGSSFVRALKMREGKTPPPARSKMPTKSFYNFRYKFKPESVDDSKAAVLEPKPGAESGFRLEHLSTQQEEKVVFNATEHPAQNWECVVVYDEETGVYTLEVLDSSLDINFENRVSDRSTRRLNGDAGDNLEVEDDAGRIHDVYEEEEEEEIPLQAAIAKPPVPISTHEPTPVKPKKPKKAASEAKALNQQPQVKSPPKGKGKSDNTVKLALPKSAGPSTIRKLSPEAQTVPMQPTPTPLALPSAAPVTLKYEGSTEGSVFPSDEEDMEPVNTLDVDVDQAQDADDDALARELDLNLMNEEEEESTMYKVEDHPATNSVMPLSLNQYAGGQYDYDSSSSDDSEG